MRSFILTDLLDVKLTCMEEKLHDVLPRWEASALTKLGSHKSTKHHFDVSEKSRLPNWPFTFKLFFKERCFDLAARTKQELEQWTRVFSLIQQLNKIGLSVDKKNPFDFEA